MKAVKYILHKYLHYGAKLLKMSANVFNCTTLEEI